MSTEVLERVTKEANKLSVEEKKLLAEKLLEEVTEQEQRQKQRIKNQAALDLLKKWREDDSGYEQNNWPGIEEAINATIRK